MSLQVVVGAGATGIATARLLADAGHLVRLVSRSGAGPSHARIEIVRADGTDTSKLTALADGAATLFNCAMPQYHRWPTDWPPLAAALLATAERTGAHYVMLGNAYGYGCVEGPITENLPLVATTVKGQVRARMWRDAEERWKAGRVRATEVRAGNFIGRGAVSLFTLMIVPAVLKGEPIRFRADLDAPHSWTNVEDAARTLIAASQTEQSWGRAWHVPSHLASVRALTERFAELTGAPSPDLTAMSSAELDVLAAKDPVIAELPEMDYLHMRPFVLDASQSRLALGVSASPLDQVLRETAQGIGR